MIQKLILEDGTEIISKCTTKNWDDLEYKKFNLELLKHIPEHLIAEYLEEQGSYDIRDRDDE